MLFFSVWEKLKNKSEIQLGKEVSKQILKDTVPVDISNCAKYFYENNTICNVNQDENIEIILKNEWPSLIIPWPHAWMEWDVLPLINANTKTDHKEGELIAGCDLHTKEIPSGAKVSEFLEIFVRKSVNDIKKFTNSKEAFYIYPYEDRPNNFKDGIAKWFTIGNLHFGAPNTSASDVASCATFMFLCDETGQMKDEWFAFVTNRDDFHIECFDILGPIFTAATFLNCKNVSIVPKPKQECPLKRHVRKSMQRAGIDEIIFKTLVVNPVNRGNAKSNDEKSTSFEQALHIVRGHFKDYRDGKGLFGKYKGIYWWDMVLRGNEKNGIIKKTYKVNSSQNNE